jgi:hypothetical protein
MGRAHTVALILWGALALACGTSSKNSGGMGAACSCGGDVATIGDWLCGGTYSPCESSLYCIDGICSVMCDPEAGSCPAGFACRQTPHSNLTIYCAPVGTDGG